MNVLFISYWGIHDALTQATVVPNIKILCQFNSVRKVILITIERGIIAKPEHICNKAKHIPVSSKYNLLPFFGSIIDFITIPKTLKKICTQFQIDKIIARGAPGGALANLVLKITGIPFFVESFEPHADYMKETKVWNKWSLRFLFQKRWEIEQCQNASGIMTVAEGYTQYLISQYSIEEKIITVPCAVDPLVFKFNPVDRKSIRKRLKLKNEQVVGIYSGKFSGLYIELNELKILAPLFDFFENFKLLILTPHSINEVKSAMSKIHNTEENILIKKVPHNAIPEYLSAADFALSLNKSFPSGKYLSPIKIGEYWANGLPVLMTEGIGDERNFLEKEKGGVIFNENNLISSLEKLQEILDDPNHRIRIPELARKYRSFDKVKEAYVKMIISPGE
jgi:glycosyltransferase involved in cell wall biosynthesis